MTAGGAGLSKAGQCRNVCIVKLSHFRGSLQSLLHGVFLSPSEMSTLAQKVPSLLKEHEIQAKAAEAVGIFTKPIMDVIRTGRSYAERDLLQQQIHFEFINALVNAPCLAS